MSGKVRRTAAVGKPGAIVHVTVRPNPLRQGEVEAGIERVALIVVQIEIPGWWGEIDESAVDLSTALGKLMRKGGVDLRAAPDAR